MLDNQWLFADRVVFNIKGENYRLVAAIDYEKGIVWIKWIGTHPENDGVDVRTVSYEECKAAPN
jgi:mRNA interferase HigB